MQERRKKQHRTKARKASRRIPRSVKLRPNWTAFCIVTLVVACTAWAALLPTGQLSASGWNSPAAGQATVTTAGSALGVTLLPPQAWYYDSRGLRGCLARKKVRRTREDIRREQKALLEKTRREIDAIVAEFHAKLPRERAQSVGAIYARYSSRFQDSIADQVRTLFEAALQRGIFIPREHVFFDLAVRGWKDQRPGLTELRRAIKEKTFQVFLVFTTSRLFRRTYKALQFVEEELVDHGIRGIFVKSNLDTADGENWRTTFQLFAAMDEAMVRMYGAHVQAAHEGLFIRRMVCTSLPLGFTGEEIPGEFTKRNLPRRRIIIDPEMAPWIAKIFRWYVIDGKSMDEIARLLNDDDDAPAPSKSLTGLWTHKLVRDHLMNAAYRGFWCYGANETKWLGGKDYACQVPRLQPLKSGQFEELRIISDELWYRAQQLIAVERANSGRRCKNGSRPRVLRGLFICPEHGRQLVVGGPQGRVLHCPLCRAVVAEKRPLFTHLNRKLALDITCSTLAQIVRADESLVDEIIAACQDATEAAQKPDLGEIARLRARSGKLSSSIDFNRRNPGETEEEQRQTEQILRDLRRQQHEVLAELAIHEAADSHVVRVPEREEVVAMLDQFENLLASAASAQTDEEMRSARRIIDELTGGRIELYQIGERKKGHGWLQGRFRTNVVSVAMGKLTGVQFAPDDCQKLEVVIDYRRPLLIDEQSEEAKRNWDQGLLNNQIAKKMKCRPSYVTKLIHYWFDSRGLSRPDGRRRRAELSDKQEQIPLYKQLADQVAQFVEEDLCDEEIARRLNTTGATVAKALAWSCRSRGIPIPTTADRKRKLLQRAKSMLEQGVLIKDMAPSFGYSARGLSLALKKYYVELGEAMPDGRTRRGNASSGGSANGRLDKESNE